MTIESCSIERSASRTKGSSVDSNASVTASLHRLPDAASLARRAALRRQTGAGTTYPRVQRVLDAQVSGGARGSGVGRRRALVAAPSVGVSVRAAVLGRGATPVHHAIAAALRTRAGAGGDDLGGRSRHRLLLARRRARV